MLGWIALVLSLSTTWYTFPLWRSSFSKSVPSPPPPAYASLSRPATNSHVYVYVYFYTCIRQDMCSYVHAFTHVHMHICFCFPSFVWGWPDDPRRGHLLGRPWRKQTQLDVNLRHAVIVCAVRALSTLSGVSRLCLYLSTLDPLWFGKGPGAEYRRRNLFSSILKDPPSPRNNVGIKSLPTEKSHSYFVYPTLHLGVRGIFFMIEENIIRLQLKPWREDISQGQSLWICCLRSDSVLVRIQFLIPNLCTQEQR